MFIFYSGHEQIFVRHDRRSRLICRTDFQLWQPKRSSNCVARQPRQICCICWNRWGVCFSFFCYSKIVSYFLWVLLVYIRIDCVGFSFNNECKSEFCTKSGENHSSRHERWQCKHGKSDTELSYKYNWFDNYSWLVVPFKMGLLFFFKFIFL